MAGSCHAQLRCSGLLSPPSWTGGCSLPDQKRPPTRQVLWPRKGWSSSGVYPLCCPLVATAADLALAHSAARKNHIKGNPVSCSGEMSEGIDWSPGSGSLLEDINAYNKDEPTEKLPFPIIADSKRELAIQLGMLDPDERDKDNMPLTARVVFVFGPDKKLKLSILYPATTGRNFDEILRVIDSLQLTAAKKVATPVDWKPGDEVMVIPSLSDDEAKKLFPGGICTKELPSGKKYLRYTSHPK
uniref:Peroxiredoxin-6 n=1 Tax=Sphaerodactylus townsendi TaxID=933632 RepID=A0ACB8F2U7_9SAUR